jgi:hypothetical protein
MWQDGATAQRLIALPNSTQITTKHERRKDGTLNRTLHTWPTDSVLARTISQNQHRLETQILHFDGEAWAGYTYQWNSEQTDATLVPSPGAEIPVPNDPAARTHTLHSRADCLRCHTPWAGHTLAFNPQQLTTTQANTALSHGLITPDFLLGHPARLTPRTDPTATPETLARTWLHANCAHCHRKNGGGSVALQVNIDLPLNDTALLNEKPLRGTLGIPETDARLIAPGHPEHSVLLPRLARTGPGHMPIIGSQTPDPHALKTLWTWITTLPASSSILIVTGIAPKVSL